MTQWQTPLSRTTSLREGGYNFLGGMAQLVEHRTVPAKVTGSSPVAPANLNKQNKWKQLN